MQLDICRPPIREDDGLPPKFSAPKQKFKKKLMDGEGEVVLKAEIIEGNIFRKYFVRNDTLNITRGLGVLFDLG